MHSLMKYTNIIQSLESSGKVLITKTTVAQPGHWARAVTGWSRRPGPVKQYDESDQ